MNNNDLSQKTKQGESWFVDKYVLKEIEANRWMLAFIVAMLATISLAIAMAILMPLKKIQPIMIYKNSATGETWVERPTSPYTPQNEAEVKSDIARYVIARESYSAYDINPRFKGVMLLSSAKEQKQYSDFQSNSNKNAPINVLGKDGTRTVHVTDVIFIDRVGEMEKRQLPAPSENLAKVDFVTTTTDKNGTKIKDQWVATISWAYRGTPSDEDEAFDNWSGFTVTYYRVDKQNI